MLNRLFVLSFVAALLGLPFLILVAQQVDGPASAITKLRTYESCSPLSPVCALPQKSDTARA